MEEIEFYNVKTRSKVKVAVNEIKKTKFERATKSGGTQVRYAVQAQYEGTKLLKFVSKDNWDKLDVPEV